MSNCALCGTKWCNKSDLCKGRFSPTKDDLAKPNTELDEIANVIDTVMGDLTKSEWAKIKPYIEQLITQEKIAEIKLLAENGKRLKLYTVVDIQSYLLDRIATLKEGLNDE